MIVLEYDSKFIELFQFARAYVPNEKLKINCFEAGLNPNLKAQMLVRQYTSYEDMYDTVECGESNERKERALQ